MKKTLFILFISLLFGMAHWAISTGHGHSNQDALEAGAQGFIEGLLICGFAFWFSGKKKTN
jgi:hypothetical protein